MDDSEVESDEDNNVQAPVEPMGRPCGPRGSRGCCGPEELHGPMRTVMLFS